MQAQPEYSRGDCRWSQCPIPFTGLKIPIPSRAVGAVRPRLSRRAFRAAAKVCGLGAVLFGAVLLGAGCRATASRQVADPAAGILRLQTGGSLGAEVDALVQPLVGRGELCGAVVGVVMPDGRTQTFRYGSTGRAGDSDPPDGDTVFQIGSVSKLFVSVLLVKLVEEGRLSYRDTVGDILPPDVRVSEEVAALTLHELAMHTAGFPREPATLSQLWSLTRYLITGENLYAHLDRDYLYRYLRRCRLKPRSQREYFYSNIGIGLLANLIEVKTGRPVPDLIVEEICRPLNMTNSVFFLSAEQRQQLAVGHVGNQGCWQPAGRPMAPWDMGEIMRPSAGMYSTLNDLLILAKASLGQLRHPLEPLLARTLAVQAETSRDIAGLGWMINRFEGGRTILTYKHGMLSGYCAYIGLNREAGVAVVVLCNTFDWDERIGHNLLLRLGGALRPAEAAAVPSLP